MTRDRPAPRDAWSEQELAILKRLWEAGERARLVSTALAKAGYGRSRAAVIGMAARMGYRRPLAPLQPASAAGSHVPDGVSLLDLRDWHCRRVVAEHPYRFCARPKARGSWCAACAAQVYAPVGPAHQRGRVA